VVPVYAHRHQWSIYRARLFFSVAARIKRIDIFQSIYMSAMSHEATTHVCGRNSILLLRCTADMCRRRSAWVGFSMRPKRCETIALCTQRVVTARTMSQSLASTPPGMPGTHPPNILVGGRQRNIHQYYYALSDMADQYWLPPVRSALSRCGEGCSPPHTPPHSVICPPNLELALTPLEPVAK